MKISELINNLEEIQKVSGDLPVQVVDPEDDCKMVEAYIALEQNEKEQTVAVGIVDYETVCSFLEIED
jgi:hypothetical protein